ncbi:BLUF domain-containing protein [Breoghania sp. L-A4]|uniref:BLUF domain-containing protein n=1 Tax=Breoghania sp. L-A4 TaxID=2304600 RepID=UPI0013C3720B|nr:BLUF domain-containing protein [Breoghania sp. L-A4]
MLLRRLRLKRILASARQRNALNDVSGALLMADGYYFQTLEGLADAVDTIFHSVERDHRHSDVTPLRRRTLTNRFFPGRPRISPIYQQRGPGQSPRWDARVKDPLAIDGADLTDIFGQLAQDAEHRRARADALLL